MSHNLSLSSYDYNDFGHYNHSVITNLCGFAAVSKSILDKTRNINDLGPPYEKPA
ncbi:hypothetical protein ACS8E3_04650 [Psychrobacter sp. 2Y5]|uniref:hypothetical protein n=1 Tax=unclassified Psychrobacter TaxID=196806 RepID=UPI003F452FF7